MRKSGLHKQISSIFDGVPVPQDEGQSSSPASEPQQEPVQEGADQSADDVAASAVSQTVSTPSLTQRLAGCQADSTETLEPASVPKTAASSGRPMPLSRNQTALKQKSGLGLLSLPKKAGTAKKVVKDPRQKKMTVVVGILSVVFAAVMFISLGGLGGRQNANAATQSEDETQVQSSGKIKQAADWILPEPLPADLRDPIKPVAKKTGPGSEGPESFGPGDFSVRGIVFSKTRPSAIVNNMIVVEGETLNGAMIINIEKDSVEFEMDGNRWIQQVQR